jgi:hypothetical protein
MILATAISTLKFRLGSRTDSDLDIIIPAEMAQAQFEFERNGTPPWFLLVEDQALVTIANDRKVALPGDFLLEAEGENLWLVVNGEVVSALTKADYDVSLETFLEVTGVPYGYAMLGQYFHLFPKPDAVYNLRLKYFAADVTPDTLLTTDTNLWLTHAPDLLMARAGKRIAAYLRDPELAQLFMTDEVAAHARLMRENVAREEVNQNRIMGV